MAGCVEFLEMVEALRSYPEYPAEESQQQSGNKLLDTVLNFKASNSQKEKVGKGRAAWEHCLRGTYLS